MFCWFFSNLILSFQLYYPNFVKHRIKEKNMGWGKSIYVEEKPQPQIWSKYFQGQNQFMPNSRGWMDAVRLPRPLQGAETNAKVQLHMGKKQLCFFAYWTKCPAKQHLNKFCKFSSAQMQDWNQLMAKLQLEGKEKKKCCLQLWLGFNCKHLHACIFTPELFPHPFWRPALNFSLTHMQEENKLLCSLS